MVPTFAIAHTFCASCDGLRKSSFLTAVPTKTGIFLCGFLHGESRSWQGILESKKKILGVAMQFSKIIRP